MSNALRNSAFPILLAATPLLVAVGVRFLGSGPSQANASTAVPAFPVLPVSTEQAALLEGLVAEATTPDASALSDTTSPFWPIDTAEPEDPFHLIGQQAPSPAEESAQFQFRVTAILPSATRPLAVIDGRPREIGAAIAAGWTLTSIDGSARTVTITNRRGQSRVIKMTASPRDD